MRHQYGDEASPDRAGGAPVAPVYNTRQRDFVVRRLMRSLLLMSFIVLQTMAPFIHAHAGAAQWQHAGWLHLHAGLADTGDAGDVHVSSEHGKAVTVADGLSGRVKTAAPPFGAAVLPRMETVACAAAPRQPPETAVPRTVAAPRPYSLPFALAPPRA